MAKTEGTQNIPAPLVYLYEGTLGKQRPNTSIHKRYPWSMPTMRAGKSNETKKQRIQRERFTLVRKQFNALSRTERERWYAGMPPYSSLLWYYNYFMLSGLMDVLGADGRGAMVIKSIQNRQITVPLNGTTITHASVIDASKTVVMLWGGSYNTTEIEDPGANWYGIGWPVQPMWGTLSNTNISLTYAIAPKVVSLVALQVIEYL